MLNLRCAFLLVFSLFLFVLLRLPLQTTYFAVYWIVIACMAGIGIIVALLVCCLCRCCPCYACCGTCRRDHGGSSSHDEYVASQPSVVMTQASVQPMPSQTQVQVSYVQGQPAQPVPTQMYGEPQPLHAQPSYPGLQPPPAGPPADFQQDPYQGSGPVAYGQPANPGYNPSNPPYNPNAGPDVYQGEEKLPYYGQ